MTSTIHPRVIVALDFPTKDQAIQLVERLDPAHCHLKIGMTMFTTFGPDFVNELMKLGYSIFLDLKFHDIPHQVAGACRSAAELGVWMLTVHTLGGVAMCEAAANAIAQCRTKPLLVGVTVLTSSNQDDLAAIGIEKPLDTCVSDLAVLAENSGLDGIVCSPWEVLSLRKQCRDDFLFVTPGIRLDSDQSDDQKRVMTPQKAIQAGSDYLVMGRSLIASQDPLTLLKNL
jgi:orotidine-5'-phosphate decarboxylase